MSFFFSAHFDELRSRFNDKSSEIDLLTTKEICDIWCQVRSEFGHEGEDVQFQIALAYAENKLNSKLDLSYDVSDSNLKEHSSGQTPCNNRSYYSDEIFLRKSFEYFYYLFKSKLEDEVLKNIWQDECNLEIILGRSPTDTIENACAIALDFLEIACVYISEESAASKPCDKSAQQAAEDVLVCEFPSIRRSILRRLLRDCRFDLDQARQHLKGSKPLSAQSKSNYSYREVSSDLTYAAATTQNRSWLPSSSSLSIPPTPLPETNLHPTEFSEEIVSAWLPPNPLSEPVNDRVLCEHFCRVFLSKNPGLRVAISPCGRELLFRGFIGDEKCFKESPLSPLQIKMDLHGLSVRHALQLVSSCQDWLLISFSPHSSVVGKQKKLGSSRLPRQVELTVVVGRGIHSAGPPRLAPAIKKYFREKGINFRLEDDGAVIKCFQELS